MSGFSDSISVAGYIPGPNAPLPASAFESSNPIVREGNRHRLRVIASNNSKGEETRRLREKAQQESEANISASQLAVREHVSDRLYQMIVRLESKAKK